MNKNTYNFGQSLRQIRQSRGLSQTDLAEAIDVSKGTIYRYENNLQDPPLQMAVRLARYFETSVDALAGLNRHQYIDVSHLTGKQRRALKEFLEIYPYDPDSSEQ